MPNLSKRWPPPWSLNKYDEIVDAEGKWVCVLGQPEGVTQEELDELARRIIAASEEQTDANENDQDSSHPESHR